MTEELAILIKRHGVITPSLIHWNAEDCQPGSLNMTICLHMKDVHASLSLFESSLIS